jgi:TolB protein
MTVCARFLLIGGVFFAVLPSCMPAPQSYEAAATDSLVEGVVYTSLRPPNWDIYLFAEPGGEPRRLTDDPALDYNAVFSPDGRWIVFTSERAGSADLYALDLEADHPAVRLTSHHAMDDAAAFSPDGKQLAFVSTRDGYADIFVMPFAPGDATAESRAVNLTRHPGGDFNPAFSPDGRRIAFSRQERLWGPPAGLFGGDAWEHFAVELYVMDADGSNIRRLSKPGPGFEFEEPGYNVRIRLPLVSGSPVWSPDGEALYYHRVGAEGAEIRRTALDGSADERVVSNGLSPAVRPDGRIAFFRLAPGAQVFPPPRSGHIASVAADGSDLRTESEALGSCFAPGIDRGSGRMVCHGPGPMDGFTVVGEGRAFSPPGAIRQVDLPDRTLEVRGIRGYFPALTSAGEVVSTLYGTTASPPEGQPALPLHVSAVDGSGLREIFRPPSGVPWGAAVARDPGTVVASVGPRFAPPQARVDIWRFHLDGSGAVNLTADVEANDALPHISANGERIVFRSGGAMSGARIYVLDGESRERRRLTDAEASGNETMPALSPDGEWVVFATDRAGGWKLWLQRVDGSEGRFLEPDRLDIPDVSMHPRFSPDGRWVVFTSDRGGFNDEWVLAWDPQAYGELWAAPVEGGPAVRLTHDKWENGPNDWGYVRSPGHR